MRGYIPLVTLAVILVPVLASADWQYTKWGMTQEEAVKASQGAAMPDPESNTHSTKEYASLLIAPYTAGRFAFTARFIFDGHTRTLAKVRLQLEDPSQCYALQGELNAKYGKPVDKDEHPGLSVLITWRDEATNNSITLVRFTFRTDVCVLVYEALNKGL